ncbi:MAG: hypothetical protein WC523_03705 [Patescibacteria group bacterium]
MAEKKTMADVWKEIEKVHGEEGLYVGDSDMTTYTDVISTGSVALDDALGIWGVPRGHIVQYAGYESSGKTLLSLCTIAEWQKKDPQNWAMFVDAEMTFDQTWAASLGVDLSRLYLLRENKGTAIMDRLVGVPGKRGNDGTVKKVKQGILDIELETGGTGLGVIVIDSVAAIQPPAEEASRAGKDNMALMARFLPPELRKLTPLLSATGVTLIIINQVRTQPGVMYGDPTISPGGQTLKHSASQMINLGMIKSSTESYIYDASKTQIGHKIRAKVQKNKKAPPFRVAEFSIEYLRGVVSKHEELRDVAAKYGVIERPNNKTWVLDGMKYNGKDAIADAIKNDELLQISLLDRTKEAKKNFVGVLLNNGEELTESQNNETDEE